MITAVTREYETWLVKYTSLVKAAHPQSGKEFMKYCHRRAADGDIAQSHDWLSITEIGMDEDDYSIEGLDEKDEQRDMEQRFREDRHETLPETNGVGNLSDSKFPAQLDDRAQGNRHGQSEPDDSAPT